MGSKRKGGSDLYPNCASCLILLHSSELFEASALEYYSPYYKVSCNSPFARISKNKQVLAAHLLILIWWSFLNLEKQTLTALFMWDSNDIMLFKMIPRFFSESTKQMQSFPMEIPQMTSWGWTNSGAIISMLVSLSLSLREYSA